jgi:hypothetical protein
MPAGIVSRYLTALLLTVIIEAAVAYLLGLRQGKVQIALAVINLATNLVLNFLLFVLAAVGVSVSLPLVSAMEICVVFAEWRMLVYTFGQSRQRFLVNSVLGNFISFSMGLLLFWI